MTLQRSFIDDLKQAEDEYEVIALCYNKLLDYISDTDVYFVAKIGHLESDAEFEPFAQQFEDFRQTIISYAQDINVHFGLDGTGFETFKDKLIIELTSFQCPEQMDIYIYAFLFVCFMCLKRWTIMWIRILIWFNQNTELLVH